MTVRIHCDGCDAHLSHEDLIGAEGKRQVGKKSQSSLFLASVKFHLCHQCARAAFDAINLKS